MDYSTIVEIFNKYGWPGIIAIVSVGLLFLLITVIRKQTKSIDCGFEKMTEKLTDTMSEQNNTMLTTMNTQNKELIGSLQEHNDKMFEYIINGKDKQHEESIDTRFKISGEIDLKLKDLANYTHASRVCVLEFHNSKENLNGLSFLWYDIHYERPAKSIPPISAYVRNQQAAALLPIVEDVNSVHETHTKVYHAADIEELADRSPVLYYNLTHNLDLKDIVYSGIYDNVTNRIVGVLAVEFNFDEDDDVLDAYVQEIAKYANSIGLLLEFDKKTDK